MCKLRPPVEVMFDPSNPDHLKAYAELQGLNGSHCRQTDLRFVLVPPYASVPQMMTSMIAKHHVSSLQHMH